MGRPCFGRAAILVGTLVAALGVRGAGAGGFDPWLTAIHEALVRGDGEAIVRRLKDSAFGGAMRDPATLRTLAMEFEGYSRLLTLRGDGAAIDEAFAILLPAADRLHAASPQGVEPTFVWACFNSTHQRLLGLRRLPVDLARWKEVIDVALRVLADAPPDASRSMQVVRWIGEYAEQKEADATDLLAKAEKILEDTHRADEANTGVTATAAPFYRSKARFALLRGRRKDAETYLETGLGFVTPHLGPTDPERRVGHAHTDLITLAHDLKMDVGDDYRTEERRTKDDLFAYRLPISISWQVQPLANEQQVLVLMQFGPEGHSLRGITVVAYDHRISYDIGNVGKLIPGSNAKMLAEHKALYWAGMFRTLDEQTPVKVAKPCAGLRAGPQFRVSGEATSGEWTRMTDTLLSSKRLGRTIELVVTEFEDGDMGRSELEYVLSSLAIPP